MKAIIIGPSCVGKSTLGKYAAATLSNCDYYNLDDLVKATSGCAHISEFYTEVGKDRFLELCIHEIQQNNDQCDEGDHLCLFDLGAGGMQSDEAGAALANYCRIAINCRPLILYRRYKNRHLQTSDNFKQLEFSERQCSIYDSATLKLSVTSLDEAAAKAAFVSLLKKHFSFLQ